MNNLTKYLSISVFAIFIGSQITEGALLVPFWQSMSASEFYVYYGNFGPGIGRFYTILTIVAALIPIVVAFLTFHKNKDAFKYAMSSTLFALAFIACFYIYFKGTNELFYESAFSPTELSDELNTWAIWHWSRIGLEVASLFFLMLAFKNLDQSKSV